MLQAIMYIFNILCNKLENFSPDAFKRHCLRISGRFEILHLRFCSKSQISKTVIWIRIVPNISLLAQTVSELQPFKFEKTGKSVFFYFMISKLHINHPHDCTKVMTTKMCCQTTFEQRITSIILVPCWGWQLQVYKNAWKTFWGEILNCNSHHPHCSTKDFITDIDSPIQGLQITITKTLVLWWGWDLFKLLNQKKTKMPIFEPL